MFPHVRHAEVVPPMYQQLYPFCSSPHHAVGLAEAEDVDDVGARQAVVGAAPIHKVLIGVVQHQPCSRSSTQSSSGL